MIVAELRPCAAVLIFLLVSLCAQADYSQAVSADNPTAWYRFGDKTTANGAAAKDETGRHSGVYHGSVISVSGVAGIGSGAAQFDGTGAYVDIPDHQDFSAKAISVECWFRSQQPWTVGGWPASATLVSKATPGNASSDWTILGAADGPTTGCIMARPGPRGSTDGEYFSPGNMNDNAWHHLVWTRSESGRNQLYIDGGLVSDRIDKGGSIANNRPIQIGGDPFLKGAFFRGDIAELAIYSTVLSEDRIVAHLTAAGREPRVFPQIVPPPEPTKPSVTAPAVTMSPGVPLILSRDICTAYVDTFNANDQELYKGAFSNASAGDFLKGNIPLLDCPDETIQSTYYFRWWTYRKHIKETPAGFVVDEFLPNVNWAGKFNTISCPAGHHLYEGRWLRNPKVLDDYSRFWFRGGGDPRRYSFWAADAIWARYCVSGDRDLVINLLPDLIANYQAWEDKRRDGNGLYWQIDDRDGMEVSIGGSGYRATINSYQYGDAVAIAKIADLAGRPDVAQLYREKAATIKKLVQEKLWDPTDQFFKVLPRGDNTALVSVRELHGFTPWYVNLPDPNFAIAWKQLTDPQGFYAPFGPTSAERRSPKFALAYTGHECQWNGPSWPFATAITLTGLANLLNGPPQDSISADDYFNLLRIYAGSQRRQLPDGRTVPWIDENLNPLTGDWISRTLLVQRKQAPPERGKDYNHSTFCDLVISGLIGLRPRPDETVEVTPLTPLAWDWFCLDRISYHGRMLTILFDKTGEKYGKGKGLRVFADGTEIAASATISRVTGTLPPLQITDTVGGWRKFAGNPVMGGKYGTCFDIAVLRETEETYRMWLSWRPQRAIAMVTSNDGIHWSEPPQIVLGPRPETGWEGEINRPVLLRRENGYHMWYTGQNDGRSWIGYATSPDGTTWTRMSDKPVLSPEQPWEKVAVMCPHVLWDPQAKQYRMWYSGGEQNEPNAIGYATSPDGLNWTRNASNPIFTPAGGAPWEHHKVTACQVEYRHGWYLMFYIGFRDEQHAQIGIARSRDGISNWQRHPENPVIRPGINKWDHDACYKPYAIFDGSKWLLWYNGRHGSLEQIGVVLHDGEDLGFD